MLARLDHPQWWPGKVAAIAFLFMFLSKTALANSLGDKFSNPGGSLVVDIDGAKVIAPALKTDVSYQINGVMARAYVIQTFRNDSEHWVNAAYMFPLPETAAVDELTMKIGVREIVGVIKEKQEAKRIFENAKREGKKASIVEQKRPNLFTSQVANIAPGEEIQIEIAFHQKVLFENNQFSLRFPTTFTPRFNPASEESEGHGDEAIQGIFSFAPSNEPNFNLTIELNAGISLKDITSSNYFISVEEQGYGSYRVALPDNQIGDADFDLRWSPNNGEEINVILFTETHSGYEYGSLIIHPQGQHKLEVEPLERELIFVLDSSGSMDGEPFRQAVSALHYALDTLLPNERFNIIEFNSHATALWSRTRLASEENVADAKRYAKALVSGGGTNIDDALRLAFNSLESSEQLQQILFLTDGAVSNESHLINLINKRRGDARIFSVGIGGSPNAYFMNEAASVGGGAYTYIGDVTQIKREMSALLDKMAHPVASDLKIEFDVNGVEVFPKLLPDLYLNEPIVVSYRSPAPINDIQVSGFMASGDWLESSQSATGDNHEGTRVLWARDQIAHWERHQTLSGIKDLHRSEILQIALEHHLVSRYTSLVSVEIEPEKPSDIAALDSKVPNQLSRGMIRLSQLPSTATGLYEHLIWGCVSFLGFLLLVIRNKKDV